MNKDSLYPIYGMWHVPFWQTKAFRVSVVVVGVLLLLFVLWYGIKRYRASRQNKAMAWEKALEELAQIEQQLLDKEIQGKTFYFKLTWMFKRYLNERYGFNMYGKTDIEILREMEGSGLAPSLIQDLQVIFEGTTAIKFANEQAIHERMKRDLVASIEFIKETTPIIEKNRK